MIKMELLAFVEEKAIRWEIESEKIYILRLLERYSKSPGSTV
jgi:hypothetical protein